MTQNQFVGQAVIALLAFVELRHTCTEHGPHVIQHEFPLLAHETNETFDSPGDRINHGEEILHSHVGPNP